MANKRMGGFPEPPFVDELRQLELKVDAALVYGGASTQWDMMAEKSDWVEASRTFPLEALGYGSQQELRVVQELGPHPDKAVIYHIGAFCNTMTWPAGTEDHQSIVCSDGQHPADMAEHLLALLVDVTRPQPPARLS